MKLKIAFLLTMFGLLLAACVAVDTVTPDANVAQTGTAKVVQTAVGIVVMAGTPMPTWTPVPPTMTPTITPTVTPTATPTPMGGSAGVWVKYDSDGKFVSQLPEGVYPPPANDLWGDPGYVYVRFQNGQVVESRDFPSYWPWVLFVPVGIVLIVGFLVLGMKLSTRPMNQIAGALSKSLAPAQPALPAPSAQGETSVPVEQLIQLLTQWSPARARLFQQWLAAHFTEGGRR